VDVLTSKLASRHVIRAVEEMKKEKKHEEDDDNGEEEETRFFR
jgi:hypothetical protein